MLKKKFVFNICIAVLAFLAIANIIVYALNIDDITVSVAEEKTVDVVLARSKTQVDVSNFNEDLYSKLDEKGISRDRVNIMALEQETANMQKDFSWNQWVNRTYGSIALQNNGSVVQMYGNSRYAGSNAIYIIPDDKSDNELIFDYSINFGDSFSQAGIIFGLEKVEGGAGYLRGYMFSFNKDGVRGTLYKLNKLDLSAGAHAAQITNRTVLQNLNINRSGNLSIKLDNTKIEITGGGLATPFVYNLNGEYYGNGFGFFSNHYAHGCDNIGQFSLRNIVLKKTEVQDFKELLNAPKWTNSNEKVLVNVSDISADEFNNDTEIGGIVAKLLSDDVHYIGWGNSNNEDEMRNLISNNNKGLYVENTDYDACIEETAEYIKTILGESETKDYIVVDSLISVDVAPENIKNDTKCDAYPQGSWKVDHDANYFNNSQGQYTKTGIYQDELISSFPKVGKYNISYQDHFIKTIYVHRRPEAEFTIKINGNDVVLKSTSYDLDGNKIAIQATNESTNDNGITEEEWSYKLVDDTTWTSGKLTQVDDTSNYLVRLRVKDYQDTWSYYTTKLVTKNATNPIAKFELPQKECSLYNQLQCNDLSYDPAGQSLVKYEYTVLNDSNQVIYTGSNPLANYKQYGIGEYVMKLVVTNRAGLESEEYSQKFKIVGDKNAPEVEVTPLNKISINEKINVGLKFIDTESGFKYYKYGITTGGEQTVSKWSNEIYNVQDSVQITEKDVDNYIHIIACDNAGNISEERIVGPYRIEETKFDLEIHLGDGSDENINLIGAKFSLVHPKEDTPDERIILSNFTDNDGICHIIGKAMGAGTYEYILYETSAPVGYEDTGLVLLNITFDNVGRVTKVEKKYNDNYEIVSYSATGIVLDINNVRQSEDERETFDFKIELVDKNDHSKKVSGATYRIVEKADSGEDISLVERTNSHGIIRINDKFSGDGQIVLYVKGTEAGTGYSLDSEDKAIVLERNLDTGWLSFVKWKTQGFIDVDIDNPNGLVTVVLEAEKKQYNNTLEINVFDSLDNDVKIPSVDVKLEEITTGKVQTFTTTDKGAVQFVMNSPCVGKVLYTIKLDKLPNIYDNKPDTTIEIEYNADGGIIGIQEVSKANTLYTTKDEEETNEERNVLARVGLPISLANTNDTYKLKLVNIDEVDNTRKVDNVQYEVVILENSNVVTKTYKQTDAQGEFVMNIPLKSSYILEIKEIKAKNGYVLDSNVKQIMFQNDPATGDLQLSNVSNTIVANLNSTTKELNITDTDRRKIDGNEAKANVNIYFGKKDLNGSMLGNVAFDITELVTNQKLSVTTDMDGNAITDDFNIPSEGKYIFEIKESAAVTGYDNSGVDIKLEIVYEIFNNEMQCTSQIITKGEKYITEKNYVQYETPETFQLDIFLDVLNQFEDDGSNRDVNRYQLDLSNVDKVSNKIFDGGSYNLIFEYENGTSINRGSINVVNGIEIPSWAIYGTTTIKLQDATTPLGYDPDTNVYEIKVKKDDLGAIQIVSKSNEIKENVKRTINGAYVDNILEVGVIRQRQIMPFTLRVVTESKDLVGTNLSGIEYELKVGTDAPMNLTSGSNGRIEINNIRKVNKIDISFREVNVPTGFMLNPDVNKIILNRDEQNLELTYAGLESTIPAEDVEIDYIKQLVTVTIHKEQEFNIQIKNVDEFNTTKNLANGEFVITSNCVDHTTKSIVGDRDGFAEAKYEKVVDTTVIYTIKETKGPDGYNVGADKEFKLEVQFDSTGRVVKYAILDKNGVLPTWVEIYNPTPNAAASNNVYIKDSKIVLLVKNSDRYKFVLSKIDERTRTNNGNPLYISGAEFDISIEHNNIKDDYHEITAAGLINLDNLEGDGRITISYKETQAGVGYENANEQGKIVFTKSKLDGMLTLDKEATTVDVQRIKVDNYNQTIKLEVLNESKFNIGLKVVDALSGNALAGGQYKITSNLGDSDTKTSDQNGELIVDIGKVEHSKNVEYTISQIGVPTGYAQQYTAIDDIKVEVYFNDYGKAVSYRLLSGEDRVEDIELISGNSNISGNFDNNEMNLCITNGEQDAYTIRVIAENENNAKIRIPGIEYEIKGYNSNNVVQFSEASKITNNAGCTEVNNVDIQHGSYVTVQEVLNVDGYCLDTTLRKVDFTAVLSDKGKKLIDYTTTDPRLIVQVDNINNIIEIRVTNEPKDVNVVINKKDYNDKSVSLADAGFDVVDQNTQIKYRAVVDDNGIGSTNIPIKPDGTYIYDVIETDAPIGYAKSQNMQFEITFANNVVDSASVITSNSANNGANDLLELNLQKEKYLEFTAYDEEKDTSLSKYAVQLTRIDSDGNVAIEKSKNKIEIVNSLMSDLTKEAETDANGKILFENAIKAPGITAIKISEITPAEGYIWYSKDVVVKIDRNSETDELKISSVTGAPGNSVSFDHTNKIINITLVSSKISVYNRTDKIALGAFSVEVVGVVPETHQPVDATYSITVHPGANNTSNAWGATQYSFPNRRTTKIRSSMSTWWHGWENRWDYSYRETGSVQVNSIYADEDIVIDVDHVNVKYGYYKLPNIQSIELYRDPISGEFSIVQEGENTVTTISVNGNGNKIVIQVPLIPFLDIKLMKYNKLDANETMENVEFEVTSNLNEAGKVYTGTTDASGEAHVIVDDVQPNKTIEYTIKEKVYKPGFKKIDDIVLRIQFNNVGGIVTHQIISGGKAGETEIKFRKMMYYPLSGKSYMATNKEVFKQNNFIDIMVANRNSFDIEILNEDTDYSGLGVEGSKFSITYTDETGTLRNYTGDNSNGTDSLGLLKFTDLVGSGNLTLHYEQTDVGGGYKPNQITSGDIEIYKDPVNYRVEVKNTTGPISHVECGEENGIIKVVIKNEKELKWFIEKHDIKNTNIKLQGAVFKVSSQVVERDNVVVDEDVITYPDQTTDANGLIELSFGKPEANVKVAYMLEEIVPPTGYSVIGKARVLVTFDEKAAIYKVQNNLSTRAKVSKINVANFGTQISNGNMNTNANGDNVLGYNIKLQATDEMLAGKPVNNIEYKVDIYVNNNFVTSKPVTTQNVTGFGTVTVGGLAELNNLTHEGTVRLEISEQQTPLGYKLETNPTIITLDCAYQQAADYSVSKDLIPDVVYDSANSTLPKSDVDIIKEDRDVIINLKKDKKVEMQITNLPRANAQSFAIPTKTYRITSYEEADTKIDLSLYNAKYDKDIIDGIINTEMVKSTLNSSGTTGNNNSVTIDLGRPMLNRTIVYVIEEEDSGDYFDVTRVGIKYDEYGLIERYFFLTDNSDVEFDNTQSYVGEAYINLNAYVDANVLNNEFELRIEKTNYRNNRIKLDNVEFKVEVYEDVNNANNSSNSSNSGLDGTQAVQSTLPSSYTFITDYPNEVTDINGNITISDVPLSGRTVVRITEITGKNGYILDTEPCEFIVKRRSDGLLKLISKSDKLVNNIKVDEQNYIVDVNIQNKIDGVGLAIGNAAIENKNIFATGAEFEIIDTEIYDGSDYDPACNLRVNGIERAIANNGFGFLILPKKTEGTHIFKVKEITPAPGFVYDDTEVVFEVEYDSEGKVISAIINSGGNISNITDIQDDYVELIIYNEQEIVPNGPYTLNVIKVNENDKEIVLPGAQFDIEILNEIGVTTPIKVSGTTDGNGTIPVTSINGVGLIKAKFVETVSPKNYLLNLKDMSLEVYRDETTGQFILKDATNVDVQLLSSQNIINVYIADKQDESTYTMVLNKVDEDGNKVVSDKTRILVRDSEGKEVYETNSSGRIILGDSKFPETDGIYSYFIEEVQEPNGHVRITDTMEVQLKFETSEEGTRKITDVVVVSGEDSLQVDRFKYNYVELNVINQKSGFRIEKVDSNDDLLKIIGTEFEITNEDTHDSKNIVTNEDGFANIKFDEGTYKIVEKQATSGFVPDTTEIRVKVEIDGNGQEKYTVLDGFKIARIDESDGVGKLLVKNVQEEMDLEPYSIQLIKTDADDRDIRIDGAEMRINVSNENGVSKVTKTALTDDKGIVAIDTMNGSGKINLEFIEITAPETRKLNSNTMTVELTRDETTGEIVVDDAVNVDVKIDNENRIVKVYIVDEYLEGYYSLVIQKADILDYPIEQSGIVFEVKKEGTVNKIKATSIDNGKIIIKDLKVPETQINEAYILQEKVAPNGYILNSEDIKINLQFREINGIIKLIGSNIDNTDCGQVKRTLNTYVLANIRNQSESDARFLVEKVNSEDETLKIPGVKFEVVNENTFVKKEYTTSDDGMFNILLSDISVENIYSIKEIYQNNGFDIINEIRVSAKYNETDNKVELNIIQGEEFVTISEDKNGISKLVVKDDQLLIPLIGGYNIELVKCFEDDIEITKENALIKLEIENEKGALKQIKQVYSNNKGIIEAKNIQGCGDITLTMLELEAPENYQLDTVEKIVKLHRDETNGTISLSNSDNIDIKDVEIDNDEKLIRIYVKNKLEDGKYNLAIQKQDQFGNNVRKDTVHFNIKDSETGLTKEYISNENGKIILESLDIPNQEKTITYEIRETQQPSGYKLEDAVINVAVEFKQNNGNMEISNVTIDNTDVVSLVNKTKQYVGLSFVNENLGGKIKLESSVYLIDDLYIDRVYPNTTIADFVSNLDYEGTLTIKDKKGNPININDTAKFVGTEFTVRVELGDEFIEKTVAVLGDMNGDGEISIIDISSINKAFINKNDPTQSQLNELKSRVVDITGDKDFSIMDVSRINRFFVNIIDSLK